VKTDIAYPTAHKWVDNIASRTVQSSQTNTQPIIDTQPIRAVIIPVPSWDWPTLPGKIMQGRPAGSRSFGNGLLHSSVTGA
jgi:hypothetical protein